MKSPLPPPINQTTGEPSWRWRRSLILATIGFCMIQTGRMVDASDTQLNIMIASGYFWLGGVLAIAYSGLATIQDLTAIIVTRSGRPYADIPPSVPPIHAPADQTVVVQRGGIVGKVDQFVDPESGKKAAADPTEPPPGFAS